MNGHRLYGPITTFTSVSIMPSRFSSFPRKELSSSRSEKITSMNRSSVPVVLYNTCTSERHSSFSTTDCILAGLILSPMNAFTTLPMSR